MAELKNKGLLNDLAEGQDDFDTDMMAAGCRVRFSDPVEDADPVALVELYGFDKADLTRLLDNLVKAGDLGMDALYQQAEKVVENRQKA